MKTVTIYHKDYCPYCKASLKLFREKGIDYHAIEVTNNAEQYRIMVERSGRRTVPQIFVDDAHIGGFTDLQAQLADGTFPVKTLEPAALQ